MTERLRLRDRPIKDRTTRQLFNRIADALEHDWASNARPSQLPPPGEWRFWLLLAGRGFGKTRAGAEWVRSLAESGAAKRIALVAPTAADCRDVMIEGESGILAIAPAWSRPNYEPSRRRLTWPNGAIATTYSADEPERLRGPQHDAAWCDEICAWRYPAAWDNLLLGLRLGKNPRAVITTTPKPISLVRNLIKRAGKDVVVTRGSTRENAANLSPAFLSEIINRYEGTRLGRQELDAELLEDTPGAFWNREQIERCRAEHRPEELARVIVAIDPAGGADPGNDETGIIVAGIDGLGRGFVLDDLSGRYRVEEWAKKAIAAYRRYSADRIVAETNFGGQMVESVLRSVDDSVSFKAVSASRGKVVRAEPVSALYEQGKVSHVGAFPQLEDQMCAFGPDFSRATAGYSPDRVDALVWALTELMVSRGATQGIVDLWRWMAANPGKPVDPKMFDTETDAEVTPMPKPDAPPATVKLKAPRPWADFYVDRTRYTADSEGFIQCDLVHQGALIKCGCTVA